MAKSKKSKKKIPVSKDLWHEPATCSIACLGSREEVTLYLSQELWQEEKKNITNLRSMHEVVIDSTGTEIRLPIESARQLFHALGCVLGEP